MCVRDDNILEILTYNVDKKRIEKKIHKFVDE